MKCFFRHNWIYKNSRMAKTAEGDMSRIYGLRVCSKCGKIQENNGYFDCSFGMENNWVNKWFTIGYDSSYTGGESQNGKRT